MKPLTESAVRARIRAYIDRHHEGNQAAAARAWGYSRPYLWRVLNGHKRPPERMLQRVKVKRVIEYRG